MVQHIFDGLREFFQWIEPGYQSVRFHLSGIHSIHGTAELMNLAVGRVVLQFIAIKICGVDGDVLIILCGTELKQPTALFQKLETIRQDRGASCGIHDGIHAVGEPVKHCFGVDCGIAAVHQNGVNAISVQNIQFGLSGSQADHMVCVGVFEQLLSDAEVELEK